MHEAAAAPTLEDRALGAYLGLGLGDALGATVEFMTPREIAQRFAHGLGPLAASLPRVGHPFVLRAAVGDDNRRLAIGRQHHRRAAQLGHIARVDTIAERHKNAIEARSRRAGAHAHRGRR